MHIYHIDIASLNPIAIISHRYSAGTSVDSMGSYKEKFRKLTNGYYNQMGNCVGGSGGDRGQLRTNSVKADSFKKMELDLINLMYENLSKRCRNGQVARETFDQFFHSSGLIGEILFLKFDKNKTGSISFVEFQSAFELMIKGSLRQRADILFEIYDVNGTGGVKYDELLKILFSYNIEELNKMFVETKFLEYVGVNQLNYYFGAEHRKIQEKNILVEEQAPHTVQPKKQMMVPSSVVLYKVTADFEKSSRNIPARQEINNRSDNLIKKFKQPSEAKPRTIACSTLLSHVPDYKKTRKTLKIQSNVASLTKKYANYLFSSAELNKEKDVFSKENFFHLIQEHPSLFNAYLTGFHTYIWQVDENDEPEYYKAIPWIESEATERFHDDENQVFLKFVHKTVFVLKNKKKKMPKQIINLEGLTVDLLEQKIKEKISYGIVFKHRDGLYDAKEYFFEEKSLYDEWVKHLVDFRNTTMEDLYVKLEKIGGGNFSSVFRGKDKKTNQEVAIKVIETFKLSVAEKEVLKRQTGILKQCHHPNIIKFIAQFKTKTHIYIITEILNEGDLFEYTKKNSFLEEYEAAIILKQLVDSIIYLNDELGVIHRDLKPENVLVKMGEEKKIVNRVKLIDFGFGVFKDKIADLSIKQKFAGTPGFIAPQIYKTEEYDEKVDTFSLGIILFFMLSGKFPFHSPFLQQIESLTKSCTISMQNNHWSNISEQAKDLLTKILCFKEERINTKQVAEHPWLKNIDHLKKYMGRNPKNVKGYLE